MSSATSTDTLQPWQLFTLAGLIGATVVVFMSRGQTPAGVILLSLTIFTAAVVGLAAWRTFTPFTSSEDTAAAGPQMIGGRTRAALEREKALVLRSIKELEFDRAMGKVSDKDFADMSTRLRVRAAGLIRQLDAGSVYREEIEKDVARRAGRAVSVSGSERIERRIPDPGSRVPDPVTVATSCSSCSTANDPDARFCKHCGAALRKPA
ncbi:MAG: zinc ribbon domain-containing protein [Vicinamibacterales bacterium]